jgi:hypothetical protein
MWPEQVANWPKKSIILAPDRGHMASKRAAKRHSSRQQMGQTQVAQLGSNRRQTGRKTALDWPQTERKIGC